MYETTFRKPTKKEIIGEEAIRKFKAHLIFILENCTPYALNRLLKYIDGDESGYLIRFLTYRSLIWCPRDEFIFQNPEYIVELVSFLSRYSGNDSLKRSLMIFVTNRVYETVFEPSNFTAKVLVVLFDLYLMTDEEIEDEIFRRYAISFIEYQRKEKRHMEHVIEKLIKHQLIEFDESKEIVLTLEGKIFVEFIIKLFTKFNRKFKRVKFINKKDLSRKILSFTQYEP